MTRIVALVVLGLALGVAAGMLSDLVYHRAMAARTGRPVQPSQVQYVTCPYAVSPPPRVVGRRVSP